MRRDWTKDYRETTGPDGKKRFAYTGDRFELTRKARGVYARVTLLAALILALLAAAGLLDSPGSRALYVALPWAVQCFAAALSLFDGARILMTRRALTARDHSSCALRLKKALVWTLALSALAAACDALYFLTCGRPANERLPLMLSLICFALSIFAYRLEKAAVWNRVAPAP